MSESEKKRKKVNSRWRSEFTRYPPSDERAKVILPRCREQAGWHKGARVSR